MTIKQASLTLVIALVLALTATLGSLSQILPAPLAYFIIALVAAGLSLALANRRPGPAHDAARRKTAHETVAGSTGASVAGSKREQGKVKWFSASKGFGFITRDSGEDIFVHFRSINTKGNRVLRDGQRVEFSIGNGSKGQQAEDVTALT